MKRAKTQIGDPETLALVERLAKILMAEPDGVRRQQAIEILMAGHCSRMASPREATIVLDAMAKHAMQIMGDLLW